MGLQGAVTPRYSTHSLLARLVERIRAWSFGILDRFMYTYRLGSVCNFDLDENQHSGTNSELLLRIFVVQHIITFFGFIVAVMMHLPSTALYSRVYIYIPIGLYLLDRIIRSARYTWNNARPGRATLTVLEGGVTKVCIQSKAIKKWSPGSHVFLSIPTFGIGQSHPATIASVPKSDSGKLVFILKGHRGFTSRLHKSAISSSSSLAPTSSEESTAATSTVQISHL